MKPSETTISRTIIDIQNPNSKRLLHVEIDENTQLILTLATVNSSIPVNRKISDTAAIQQNQWLHFAISYDQNEYISKIFINGKKSKILDGNNEEESIQLSTEIPSFENATAFLGNNKDNTAVFKGSIAELALWDKSLSEDELASSIRGEYTENNSNPLGLWRAEVIGFKDFTDSNTNHGIIQGSPSYVKTSLYGDNLFSQQFGQDANDRVQINFNSGEDLKSWTLELWVKPSETNTSETVIEIQNSCLENILHVEINKKNNDANAKLLFNLANESEYHEVSNLVIQWDQWLHFAISYNYSQNTPISKIFIDGKEEESIQLSKEISSFKNATAFLGNNKNNTAVFKGTIAEFRFWNKNRSEDELKEGMESTLNGNEQGLEGLWKTIQPFYDRKNLKNNQGLVDGAPLYLETSKNGKGGTFHVVEHILLRPKDVYSLHFLKPPSSTLKDPYSNQITVVCPKWMAPFANEGYRNHFTHMVESEAPAHIQVNILWITLPIHLWQFESHYREWLEIQSEYLKSDTANLIDRYTKAHQNFIQTFNYLNSLYGQPSEATT